MALDLYKNKRVLVTGHTGFKGSWLVTWLQKLGADVAGYSDEIPTEPAHFSLLSFNSDFKDYRGDIADLDRFQDVLNDFKPDFLFHLAAQALVPESYANPVATFQTNAMGMVNVLEALRTYDNPLTAIIITSDKVYDNVEWIWGYRENDPIGGKDPYSASKGMAELAFKSYFHSFFKDKNSNIRLSVARAGNVIGGGDWAADRLVPDCIRAWADGKAVTIRSLYATRPWQHVLEPLSGYLHLGSELHERDELHGEAFNFGPPAENNYSVGTLLEHMKDKWGNVAWIDETPDVPRFHEAGLLKLNCDKALSLLSWQPCLDFNETVQFTIEWYQQFYEKGVLKTDDQIDLYCQYSKTRDMIWLSDD